MLTPPQIQVLKDSHRFRVLRCGRRWGKTTLAAKEIKGLAISRVSKIAYIANNYQQARDIMWEMLKKELEGAIIDKNEQRLEIRVSTQTNEESIIFLRGWESVENLRGQSFDFIIVDEVAQMRNFWMEWEEVLRPTLTDRKGQALFCSTPKGFNHFYDLSNKELTDKDYKSFHFTSYDNPYLPVEEIDSAKQSLPPDRFHQEYMADFRKTEGLVYKEFDRKKHLYDNEPNLNGYKDIAGIDFGFVNPAGIVRIKTNTENFYIYGEWKKASRTEDQIADYVVAINPDEVYPDPENPSAIEVLRRRNLNVREVIKGKDSVQSGIQRVRELLLQGKLKIHSSCVGLIEELETYSYDDKDEDRNKPENPIKSNDHLLDALRYAVTMVQKVPEIRQFRSEVNRVPENSNK